MLHLINPCEIYPFVNDGDFDNPDLEERVGKDGWKDIPPIAVYAINKELRTYFGKNRYNYILAGRSRSWLQLLNAAIKNNMNIPAAVIASKDDSYRLRAGIMELTKSSSLYYYDEISLILKRTMDFRIEIIHPNSEYL